MRDQIRVSECSSVRDLAASLRNLWLRLADEMFKIEGFIIPSESNADRWIRFAEESVAEGRGFLIIAECDSEIVGFTFATISREFPLDATEHAIGTINDVYVLPEYRGRGIGKRMVAECLGKIKARGIKNVRLSVLAENKAAIKLYKRLNFKIRSYEMFKRL
ncbi:MAG: GNAT family N-acetyltransferase [Candidatus Bathyarchaeia archaeon]|nr:GNAT family N-acetyltransferase [Candidatus Bathyarchaeota archaeon]